MSLYFKGKTKTIVVNSLSSNTILSHLVECDKFSIQPHQVTSLRHLTDHEGDERGVTLPLLPSQRGLRQQNAGIYWVFNCGEQQSISGGNQYTPSVSGISRFTAWKLTAEVVFGMVVPLGVIQNGWHFPAHVKLSSFSLWRTKIVATLLHDCKHTVSLAYIKYGQISNLVNRLN